MKNMIRVGMADLKVCESPGVLTTLGLGSCVGIVLYDSLSKIGGMVHVMLPDSTKFNHNENKAKYADTGIESLMENMLGVGAHKERIVAKIAGGAQMFAFSSDSDALRIGERNVEAVKKILDTKNIKIMAEDTGLNYGRTIEFYTETGELLIKSVGKPDKKI
ncbi:MAG: chemotaxis protein CheD [Lachnospiraceae bacterium]|nr:chemotaxis protein CheD [Lachnospiraceae bacterium]